MKEEQPKINEYPPIQKGEIFDPEIAIREVLKVPKAERPAKLLEFKEKLAFQKVGLARVQDLMIDEIRRHPDEKVKELYTLATELGAEFGMNNEQKKRTREVLEKYEKRHLAIEKIRKEYKKDNDLFRELFGRTPKGEIKISTGPISIKITCHDFEDYLAVWFHSQMMGFGKKRDFTDEEQKEAEGSKAVNVCSAYYPDIGWAIIAENASERGVRVQSDEESQKIFVHEEQHGIKNIFAREELLNPAYPTILFPVQQKFLSAETEKEKEKILGDFFRLFRHNAEEHAKDEILAYYKDGRFNKVYQELSTEEKDGGIYDYLAKPKKTNYLWMKKDDETKDLVKRIADRILVKEYKEILENGVAAIKKMEAGGYKKEEIIAFLTYEPLTKWRKASERVLEN